jgi:flavin-binding protein dodecin
MSDGVAQMYPDADRPRQAGASGATLSLSSEEVRMADNIYSVSQIVGTSKTGVDDAIRGAVARASKTLRNLDWFEVSEIRGHIENEQVCHYQVTMKVGFRLEEPGEQPHSSHNS